MADDKASNALRRLDGFVESPGNPLFEGRDEARQVAAAGQQEDAKEEEKKNEPAAPVVTVNLGKRALFKIMGPQRR